MVKICALRVIKEQKNIPETNRYSEELSTITLITGANRPNYKAYAKLNVGDYVQENK